MRHDCAEPLTAIRELLAELENQGIQYVVIGRQSRIGAMLAGDDDVDILVARQDGVRAQSTLLRHRFEEKAAARGQGAVADFVKWEVGRGTPIRVQLHHELRLGFSVAPAFRIPTAGELIRGSSLQGLVRAPAPSDQLALHVVKGLLAWEATDLMAGARRHPFDPEEVRLLLPGVPREDFLGSARRLFPPVPPRLAEKIFIETMRLERGEDSGSSRLRLTILSLWVRDSLAAWSDRPLLLAWLGAAGLRLSRLLGSRSPHPEAGTDQAPSVDNSEPMPAQ